MPWHTKWPKNLSIRFIIILNLFIVRTALAAEITIFDARKPVTLSENEKPLHDLYINGGSDAGLRPGMIITVTRRIPLYDTYQNRSPGDLVVRVARIKIVHVQEGLSVARLHSEFPREEMPLLEDNYIMVGDKLDLSSAYMENKKDKKAETPAPQPVPEPVANAVPLIPPPGPGPSVVPATVTAEVKPSTALAPNLRDSSKASSKPEGGATIQNPVLQ